MFAIESTVMAVVRPPPLVNLSAVERHPPSVEFVNLLAAIT